ncbi:YkuS family protein [Siminovitchia fortis]|uniref:YkuS family protein n=1 Tax=Siminovitchia fortis TaxID=254758 RepID=A0A443IPG9_9BACI|nr:YkuS family protein [Siminovitchia fortis]RWR08458.1 YkuS family protein [Siminovitchia fortis]WHY83065.1 YkuS family protein [Siminovitchia fortis]
MRIGVEENLSNVSQALMEKGYQVIPLSNASDLNNVDCCVVTGMDSNIMGIETTSTQVPVIEASGLSAEEVCQKVEQKLH